MTTVSLLARAHDGDVPESDPAARPRRRTFSAEYKALILDEYDGLAIGSPERGGCCAVRACTARSSRSGAKPEDQDRSPRQIYTGLTERKYVPVDQR